MNRLGDCICAIPAKPPEEHAPACPVRLRAAGPRCLVCGHYHGGQGGCVIAHTFVARRDCPTCVRIFGALDAPLAK